MSNKIDSEGHQHADAERARGAEKSNVARYVLGVSLVLVIAAFAIILLV